jgi:hypothetical protein
MVGRDAASVGVDLIAIATVSSLAQLTIAIAARPVLETVAGPRLEVTDPYGTGRGSEEREGETAEERRGEARGKAYLCCCKRHSQWFP